MTFELARPRYTLPFAGADYELLGDMALIESVEYALKKGIGDVTVGVVNGMPTYEFVILLATLLAAGGHKKMTLAKVKEAIWNEIGVAGEANDTLRLHAFSFLSICLAPPSEREGKAKELGELIGKLDKASPGKSTRKRV
jgi:hypothetical protein